ncbi:MAG: hypothetical protein AB7S75_21275 [Desulfococcaceae bacterium]
MKKMSKSICFFYALLLASFVMPHQVAAASVFHGLLYEAPNNLSKDTIKVYRLDIPADIRNIDNLSYLADQDVHLWNLDTDNAFGGGCTSKRHRSYGFCIL